MRAAHEWSLWSTRARVCVSEPRLLDEAVARTRLVLAEVDDAANRFRHDSEISRLGAGTTRVSPMLADLLRVALLAAETTGGAVDPTVGRAMVDLGYDRTTTSIEDAGRLPRATLPVPGWRSLRLDGDRLMIPDGVRLDLGATAKAAAADRSASRAAEALGCGVLVSLGGDIATAGPEPIGGWQVRVTDHLDDPDAHVTLSDGWALATSSTVRRTWRRAGRTWHHIVDPATGRSAATDWRTVSVAAPTCVEANAAATAVVVRGRGGLAWVRDLALPARLVDDAGRVHLVGGWPPEAGSGRAA
ncbi:FAD:protein FMN transferase [Nocardioides sp.]|uniref:FAD:protein FMN transferase n=1 Tax=Nocardioides sp. TaxID=35761 RepID=UPI002724EBDF|nr:FAD:protein FMN transferase [Nocardioides sp.]MDO9454755.1 FAD:protein FMN transferase [Nocardioides sp.]